MRKCTKCKESKDLKDFYTRLDAKNGYYSHCKLCVNKLNKRKYEENKAYRLKQMQKYQEENRDARLSYGKRHYRENKEYYNAKSAKYRAKKMNQTPEWLTEEQIEYMSKYYSHCKVLEQITGNKFHVDHIVPLQGKNVSGLHVPWNLQVLPAKENLSKGNK